MLSKPHLRAGAGLALALGLAVTTVPALGSSGDDAPIDGGVVAAVAASEPQLVSFADDVVATPASLAGATGSAAEAVTEQVVAEQAAQLQAYAAAVEAAELEAWVAAVEAAQLEAYAAAVEAAELEAWVAAVEAEQVRQRQAAPAGSVEAIIQRHFGDAAPTAIRVARCESTLNPRAMSPGGGNHGLFQINNVHRGTFESVTGAPWSAVYDAETNTRFAHWLYRQSGWGPWACA